MSTPITPNLTPSAADLDAIAAEQAAKTATAPKPPTAQAVGPSLDSDKKDSLGNDKSDVVPIGPRGDNLPGDVMTEAQKQAVTDKQDARLKVGMSSTDAKDSIGKAKGTYKHLPQGFDKHGARLPDKIDMSKPMEPPPVHVGPRGVGAPQDTYHGSKPAAKV